MARADKDSPEVRQPAASALDHGETGDLQRPAIRGGGDVLARGIPRHRASACLCLLFLLGDPQSTLSASSPNLDTLQARVDELAVEVLNKIGASPTECPEEYSMGPGWLVLGGQRCGTIDSKPKAIRKQRDEIVALLIEGGLEPDTTVAGGSDWAKPDSGSFRYRTLLLEYLPVQVAVDPAEGRVGITYPSASNEIADSVRFGPPVKGESPTTDPLAVRLPPPAYPVTARQWRLTGSVIVQGIIGRDGRVHELKVLRVDKPDLGFEEAALEALSGQLYVPATLEGEPTDLYFTATVDFTLH